MTANSFKLTEKQEEANCLLGGDATHAMLFGGSRSGKTFLILRAMAIRAIAHECRQVVLRYRFNHVKASVVLDTFPKMMSLCFPEVAERCKLNKEDWYYSFPNGSEIWFGGLDDKERTEKILGQEYATIFLNECSQISWDARNMAMTRLAQNTPLRIKSYYDCNPPGQGHWTYRAFVEHLDPERRTPMRDAEDFVSMRMNPTDNADNLPPAYLKQLENMPERMRKRFLLGLFADNRIDALWTTDSLDQKRMLDGQLPEMQRIVIGIDPSGATGTEESRSDEVGIVVAGLGTDGRGYVLEDLSGRFGPTTWGGVATSAYDRWNADLIVAEGNYGGAMVEHVIKAAKPGVPFQMVTATRGKVVRAEPISVLFDDGKISILGRLDDLEDQLCNFTTHGYTGIKSPDRADAMVWALTSIFPGVVNPKTEPSVEIPMAYRRTG